MKTKKVHSLRKWMGKQAVDPGVWRRQKSFMFPECLKCRDKKLKMHEMTSKMT